MPNTNNHKSLRDLFGSNLNESAKSTLDKAAEQACKVLQDSVFSNTIAPKTINDILHCKVLKVLDLPPEIVDFIKNNNLSDFPLDKIPLIKGEFLFLKSWLENLPNKLVQDNKGNTIEVVFDNKYNQCNQCNQYQEAFTYDENDNIISTKSSTGFSCEYKYINNNLVFSQDCTGTTYEFTYDEKGNIIYKKYSTNFEEYFTYDDEGNVLTYKNNKNYSYSFKYQQNDNSKTISWEDSDGSWYESTYYDNGNKGKFVISKDNSGLTEESNYDEKGNILSQKQIYGNDVSYDNWQYIYNRKNHLTKVLFNDMIVLELPNY